MTSNGVGLAILGLVAASGIWIGRGATTVEAHGQTAASLGTVVSIDVPGATNTFPLDINAEGVIVGRYVRGGTHGFVRSREGDLTTIDVPGASFTVATAINDRGDIVGQYALPTAPTQRHGFLLKDGTFFTLDPVGSTFTNVLGINERGDIVGRYCVLAVCTPPGTGAYRGFLFRDGEFTFIDVPGATETDPFKIDGRGRIVGGFLTAGGEEQIFVLNNGVFTALAPPGGQPVSLETGGINERGDIVGNYCEMSFPCFSASTDVHGFLMTARGFATIDIPGARTTVANGINARGEIVGAYSDAGNRFHGFLLSR